jgi:hypothetical protein
LIEEKSVKADSILNLKKEFGDTRGLSQIVGADLTRYKITKKFH